MQFEDDLLDGDPADTAAAVGRVAGPATGEGGRTPGPGGAAWVAGPAGLSRADRAAGAGRPEARRGGPGDPSGGMGFRDLG
jgi:hypothetical protein